jgi:hypothetical protein
MGNNRPSAFKKFYLGASWGAPKTISGTSGTWEKVSPAAMATGVDDDYGVQDVIADPLRPGHVYAFTCHQGVWRSTKYGELGSWHKWSMPGDYLNTGKLWGEAMSPSGRIFLATAGNNTQSVNGVEARQVVFRSYDNGQTWRPGTRVGNDVSSTGIDPYSVSCNPSNENNVLTVCHEGDHLFESLDGGVTFTDMGQVVSGANSASESSYVAWVSATQALVLSQSGGASSNLGLWLCTKSGGSWSFTRVHATWAHDHGAWQPYIDPLYNYIYVPGYDGIIRASLSDLTTWTTLSTLTSTVVVATASNLYAIKGFPVHGTNDPKIQIAARNPGTSWIEQSDPVGMDNGAKAGCVMFDGQRYVLLFGCWDAGVWRYVE